MNALVAVAVLLAWQSSVELVKRRGPAVPDEVLRKLVHIGSGLVAASMPFFLSFRTIAELGVAFVLAMALSRRLRILTSVHDCSRTTYGELFFPLGVAVLAAMHPSRAEFVYAALVLALADGFAALVGSRARRGRLSSGKSVLGSVTFFLVAAAIGIVALASTGISPGTAIATALVAAAALTILESGLRLGLDNLLLPPCAALAVGIRIDPQPLLEALYLIAPVVFAGFVHSVVIHRDVAPLLARPLDGGRTFRGRRLFGANKTWRGVIVMATTSAFGAVALHHATGSPALPVRVGGSGGFLLLGLTLGLAYSLAELPNSFVKRQLGVAPGARARAHRTTQYLLDQGDSVVGVAAVLAIFVRDPVVVAATVPLGFAVHAVADRLLYVFHVKQPMADAVSPAAAEALA